MNKLIKALRRIVEESKMAQASGYDRDGLASVARIAEEALESLPGRGKSRVHDIVVKARFDNALTAKEARYAVWNHVHDYTMFGESKPDKWDRQEGYRSAEPYGQGKITVRR